MICSTINTTQFVPAGTIVANLSLNVAEAKGYTFTPQIVYVADELQD